MAVTSLGIAVVGSVVLAGGLSGLLFPPPAALMFSPLVLLAGVAGIALGIVAVRRRSRRSIAVVGIVLNALLILGPPLAMVVVWSILGD